MSGDPSILDEFHQRLALDGEVLDKAVAAYRDLRSRGMSELDVLAALSSVAADELDAVQLSCLYVVAVRRLARRHNWLRSVRRRAIRRSREWQFRLEDAEITLRDAVEERDALRQVVGEALRLVVR